MTRRAWDIWIKISDLECIRFLVLTDGIFPPLACSIAAPFDWTVLIEWSGSVILGCRPYVNVNEVMSSEIDAWGFLQLTIDLRCLVFSALAI